MIYLKEVGKGRPDCHPPSVPYGRGRKVSAVAIDFTLSDSQQELQKNAKVLPEDP